MTLELGIDIGKVKSVIKLRLRILFPVAPANGAFWATRFPVSTQNANYRK
jgi:hypothetical protein